MGSTAEAVGRRPPGVALIGGGFIGPVHAEALRRIGAIGATEQPDKATVPMASAASDAAARRLARRMGCAGTRKDKDCIRDR